MKAQLIINKEAIISKIDPRIYGSFIEHLGRAVYGGIYEPDHKTADDMGFRRDVLELVKALNVPVVRYPGGNMVSGYHWEDGIGDKTKRPRQMELAWNSIETNQVGIDEFQEWASRANSTVMMAVNLGTRGAEDARNLVEYCNSTTDTYYANMRRKNGFDEPFNIKLWCLGNEMDGPGQIGHKTAEEYARLAEETAKLMKLVDPKIELTACGSLNYEMPTFGKWEHTVLSRCYEHVDYLSIHSYFENTENNTKKFLAESIQVDHFIKSVVAICDQVKHEKNSDKTINLSFDEWNVWYHSIGEKTEKWQVAPSMLEDVYTFEDALVVGSVLITILNNADRVKIACLAQLVNVIAPIMTETGGRAWAQTIYYPFLYTSLYARGTVLSANCTCDSYDSDGLKVPYVTSTAVLSEDKKSLIVLAVNRSLEEETELEINGHVFLEFTFKKHIALEHSNLKAKNTAEHPDCVLPIQKEIGDNIMLAPHSWNLLVFQIN